jgi:hypothetical protein
MVHMTQASLAHEIQATRFCLTQPATEAHRRFLQPRLDWLVPYPECGAEVAGQWSEIEARLTGVQ